MQSQQQFLQFRLQPDLIAAIELDLVTELLDIPLDRVLPMPHLPPSVMGVYNLRGEMLWIFDFKSLIGLNINKSDHNFQCIKPTIILSSVSADQELVSIGLLVGEIDEIKWYETELIQDPIIDKLPLELSSWVKGCWSKSIGEEILILDGEVIFDRTSIQATR